MKTKKQKTREVDPFKRVLQQIKQRELQKKVGSDNCIRCGVEYDESVECIDLVGKVELGIDRACGAHWCIDCYDKAQESKVSTQNWYHKLADWDGDNNTDLCPLCAHNPLGINMYGLWVELDPITEGERGETFELILTDEECENIWERISSIKILDTLAKEFRTKRTGRIKPKDTGGELLWS